MRALLAFAVAARPTLTLRRVRTYLIHSLCEAIRVSAPTNGSTTPVLQHGRDAALRRPDIAARFPTSCHDARARLSKFDYDHGQEHEQGKATNWGHAWRLRRHRAGDCLPCFEVEASCEI